MQVMFDHAVAFLVAAAILFTLFALQLRGQRASIDATQYYNAKHGAHSFLEMIEQDFNNMGAGMINPAVAVVTVDPETFSFYGRSDLSVPDSQLITYSWTQVSTAELEDGPVDTYRVTRSVNGAPTGQSFDGVTNIEITLRNEILQQITTFTPGELSRTRRIDVSVSAVSTLGVAETIEETRWFRRIRPANMLRLEPGGSVFVSGAS